MRVHVTGGSGFLGGHVVPRLVAAGCEVSGLARTRSAAERLSSLGAEPVHGDLDDPTSLDDAFCASRADALVSLASLGFGHAPSVVAAAEQAGMRRTVFVSTTAIFTALAASTRSVRLDAEEAVRSSGLDWTIVRPTMIYGTPSDRNMVRLVRLVQRSPLVPLPGGGRRLQQPVHVADLADTIVSAVATPDSIGRAFDVAGPEPLTLRQVVEQTSAAVGRHPRLVPMPLTPAIATARLYERCSRHPRLRAEQVERLAEDKAFDIGPATEVLGHRPRPFAEGIREEAELCR